ncbi:MAG: hypothetical protein A2265_11040 [Bacteroidetes bacterium RIFOXYA12_FULL_33_9]|nr:MAG: hypothetical protein A2265_11040 [Bacteroidetes bacterium RIFOXYA12_FULL_33_9]
MKQILSVLIILSVFFNSCTTEFDVIDEWKDITVIYCLLNQNDTIHYAKIEKAFLGEADAYEMAKISDSLYYDNITVSLEEYDNDNLTNIFYLEKTTEIPKDTGIFADDNNVLYKTDASLISTRKYRLVVYNPDLDKTVYGETKLINGIEVTSLPPKINIANYEYPYSVEWKSSANARIYNVSVDFHYFEINLTSGDTTFHTVKWNVGTKISSNASSSSENMYVELTPQSILKTLASNITIKDDVIRVVHKDAIDIIFQVGGADLYTYMEVNGPSFSVIQEKPEFTNIVDGIGLMSSLYDKVFLSNEITDRSVDSVAHSIYTSKLSFEDHTSLYYQAQF